MSYFPERAVTLIAGPCAVESYEQLLAVARLLKSLGLSYMRAGAYKPRTSPDSFQGLGAEGLAIIARVKRETGIKVVSEAVDCASLALMEGVVDVIQIGARNMQNFSLLKKAAHCRVPVLLKRSFGASVHEWLEAGRYLAPAQVIYCERGIKTFEPSQKALLDLGGVKLVREATGASVIVDPSHAPGRSDLVAGLALAAVAAGADGILIEIHPQPASAKSDAAQALTFPEFEALYQKLCAVAVALGKRVY